MNPKSREWIGIRFQGVPVLLYHGLHCSWDTVDPRTDKYSVGLSRFEEQLSHIRQLGYNVELLRTLWPELKNRHSVAITFDDGHASNYEIGLPALLKYGFRADFFIHTSSINSPGFMTWKQIREMHKEGVGIHSHSHDHVVLSRLPEPALKMQLWRSKKLLEDHIDAPVDFLAAPYGFVSRRVVQSALEAGYKAVCNSSNWPARPGAALIPRTSIYNDTSSVEFLRLLRGQPGPYLTRALRTAVNHFPKLLMLRFCPGRLGVRVAEKQA
jgi:peptidoglycan/xylan/chitin deacetylase (PgdA/CDA1 family)